MRQKRVLLAEDEPLLRRSLARLLRRFLEVREVASFDEAVELLGREAFDVVLSDRHLGDEDGVDLLRIVAETFPLAKRILMTGNHVPDVTGPGAPHQILQKPFAPAELLRAIADEM